ncbi:helix-turn-helix domain-containing protein [Klebsiella quasipneumoniae]|uniref:helix-turn-helix domain-containing protein n=1 Tax=Klebsiella quasipneumoniae TaxID=1463165 RepID=UPI00215BE24C|nr:helix-turn-helix domain-containing protein [Klebsiella quasipneumoniae]MDS0271331.1 helix-turn-helix domain-containing protein [Klebsiella quasipneumoniae]
MNKETQQKISKAASRACIGKHFGISGQAVGKWIYENGVPQKRIVPLCRFLNWEVTPHEIDPEAYPTQLTACRNRKAEHANTSLSTKYRIQHRRSDKAKSTERG